MKRKESRSRFQPRSLCLPAKRLTARPMAHTSPPLLLPRCILAHTRGLWSPRSHPGTVVTSAPVGYLTPCTSSPSAIATIEHDTLTQAREFTKAEVVQWVWGWGGVGWRREGGGTRQSVSIILSDTRKKWGWATLETQ